MEVMGSNTSVALNFFFRLKMQLLLKLLTHAHCEDDFIHFIIYFICSLYMSFVYSLQYSISVIIIEMV